MRMLSKIVTAVVFSAAAAALPAKAEEAPKSFTHEGVTYVYSASLKGNSTVITGNVGHNSSPFRLEVHGDRVIGQFNGTPVSFRVKDAAGIAKTQITMR